MKTLTPLFSSALPPSALPVEPTPLRTGPPWRILLALAALVLLAHVLALGTAPRDFGPTGTKAPASAQVAAMLTRSIAVTPPAPVRPAAATAGTAKPTAKAKAQPAPPETPAVPQTPPAAPATPAGETAQTATDPAPNGTPAEPSTPAAPDSRSASTDTSTDASTRASTVASTSPAPEASETSPARSSQTAAGPAASAPAAPPAAPSQTPVTAMALPGSAQMGYEVTGSVKGLSYNARGELLWRQRSDSSYDVSMTVSAMFLGSRGMTSQGQVGPQGLVPTRFSDKSRTEVAAHFEPEKGQISFSTNTPSMPWLQGGQDRASVFIQLGGMLAGNPAGFPPGSTISVYTVGPRDAEIWTFRIEGEETLRLPFGQLAAIKVSRQLRHERDQQLDVWYAPSLGYLPVRNKITQTNGDFVDQQLSSISRP